MLLFVALSVSMLPFVRSLNPSAAELNLAPPVAR